MFVDDCPENIRPNKLTQFDIGYKIILIVGKANDDDVRNILTERTSTQ